MLVARRLASPRGRRRCHVIDVICLAVHVVLWIALPAVFLPLQNVVALYVVRNICLGVGLFVLLAPSHFPPEAACAAADQKNAEFDLKQTAATVNYRANWYGRMLCSGLDSQIEHHLFPAIAHRRLPEVRELVREYCAYHGLPYRQLGWLEAVSKSVSVFVVPKRVENELRTVKASRSRDEVGMGGSHGDRPAYR